jgi:hypothetical protein
VIPSGKGGGKGKPQPRRKPPHRLPFGAKPPRVPGGKSGGGKPQPRLPFGAKPPAIPQGKHKKRHLAGTALGGWWITGGNDVADNCAAVAVANSLLLATGYRTGDGELLRLHDRAGPLSIPEALAAFREVMPCAPVPAELAVPGNPGLRVTGVASLLAGLATPHGPHAALLLGDGLVTWGGVMDWPDDWLLEETWEVTW